MKKTQKLIVLVENVKFKTTYENLDESLLPLAKRLYETTHDYQKDGLIGPSAVAELVDGMCISMMWDGKVPKCTTPTQIFGTETTQFLKKQY